ncbi:MAG: hypothetical protein KAT25_04550 [Sulfuriflexus sp.]|nr:hypothetical protein [Sulfuriflexus sp.]
MNKLLAAILLMSCTFSLHAKTIDLECEVLANKMVTKLVDEGLLLSAEQHQIRARAISVALCSEVQKTAEVQHQKAQTSALQNWIFENRPDKPGNKRLKRLK